MKPLLDNDEVITGHAPSHIYVSNSQCVMAHIKQFNRRCPAVGHSRVHRFDDARSSIQRASRYRTNTLGPGHPEIASLLNNLAFVNFKLGNVQEADSIFQDALDIQRDAFVTDPNFLKTVSTVLCNIAYLHAKNGMFSKALIELEGALEIRQDILCENVTALTEIHENMAHLMAISHLQKTAGDLDAITEEYISMLRK